MCHLGIIQLKLGLIKFCFLCDMNAVKFKVWDAQNVRRGKGLFINSFPKSTITWTNRRCRFFENGKTKKRSRFAPFSQARTVQRWRLGVDVQELTESIEIMNAKSLNYWQEVANELKISRVDDIPLGHFTVLSGCGLKRFLVILTDFERFHSLYLFSSVFQGANFYKCNVKVVINCSNCDHMWISIL